MSSSSSSKSSGSNEQLPVAKLLTVKGVSQSGIAKLVGALNQGHSQRGVKRKLQSHVKANQQHTIDLDLICSTTGEAVSVPFANVATFMESLAQQNGFFMQVLSQLALKNNPEPFQLLLYFDEVVPGNVISPDNQRKSYILYVSFLRFNTWLGLEESWLPVGVVRHKTVDKIAGGFSAYMCAVIAALQKQLCPEAGLCFKLGEASFLLSVNKEFLFLADEAALKSMLSVKGASGMKPCFKCKNVLYKAANKASKDPYFTTISEPEPHCFDRTTDEDVNTVINYLEAAQPTKSKKEFEQLQTLSGFNFVSEGVLGNQEVRSTVKVANVLFDPMHCYFSNGLVGAELSMFFKTLAKIKSVDLSWDSFALLVTSDWKPCSHMTMQKCTHSRRVQLCRSRLVEGADHYRGSASELLSITPFLIFFVDHVAKPMCDSISSHCDSFLSLLLASKLLYRSKLNAKPLNTELLLNHQRAHMQMFCHVYGEQKCRPKHHYQFHLGEQYEHLQQVVDCFATERKNAEFKLNVAPFCRKLQIFERSCLNVLMVKQAANDLDATQALEEGLQGAIAQDVLLASELGTSRLEIAVALKLGMVVVKVGCFRIFPNISRGLMVQAALSTDDGFFLLGEIWSLEAERLNFAYSWWSRLDGVVVVSADEALVLQLSI